MAKQQHGITLWTGVDGNGSIHDGDGRIGHGLTMDIAKGLSSHERICHACIDHLDIEASDHEGKEKSSLIDQRVLDTSTKTINRQSSNITYISSNPTNKLNMNYLWL